jgi:hypothetical protein
MDTQPVFGPADLIAVMVGDMAKAISERSGETRQQALSRYQAAVRMIMSFLPRDVIEAILAGHCVMFHEVMTDSVRETLRGEPDTTRRGTRSNLVALNRVLSGNLDRLARSQSRPVEGQREEPEAGAEAEMAERAPPAAADAPARAVPVRTPVAETRTEALQARAAPVPAPVAEARTPAVPVRTPVADTRTSAVPAPGVPVDTSATDTRTTAAQSPGVPALTPVADARTAAGRTQAVPVRTPVEDTRTAAARTPVTTVRPPATDTQTPAARPQAVPVQADTRTAATDARDVPMPAADGPPAAVRAEVAPTPAAEPRDVPVQGESKPVAVPPAGTINFYPSIPEAIAACKVNPEAMAALEAGDAAGFARAMGVEQPSDGFLTAAATPGSPFDREAAGPWPAGRTSGTPKT